MDGYQCPKCRTVCYPGLMGYPRYHHCHEQLRQCRYCQHEAGGLCTLEPAQRPRLEEDDGKPWCEAYVSRLSVAAKVDPWARPLPVRHRILGLALAMVLLFVFALALVHNEEKHPLRIDPETGRAIALDGYALVGFVVHATPGQTRQVVLRIDPEALQHYAPDVPTPTPISFPPPLGGAFGFLVPANGELLVRFPLRDLGQAPRQQLLRVEVLDETGEAADDASVVIVNRGRS